MMHPSSYANLGAPAAPMAPPPIAQPGMPPGPPPPAPPTGPRHPGGYAPYAQLDRPLLRKGKAPVPKNDEQAMNLVRNSKAALDFQMAKQQGAHPAVQQAFMRDRQEHIDAVAHALHQYHKASPTRLSGQMIDAMHNDPNLKISHAKPPTTPP